MKRYFLSYLIVISYLFSAEPSAFDAGRLDSNNPYGLTETEKYLLNTSNKLQNITKSVGNIQIQIDKLNEQQEGITSVLDGVNIKIASMTKTIQTYEANLTSSVEQLKTELNDLRIDPIFGVDDFERRKLY